jgi:RNA polymerase primary sigma factor
MPCVIDVDAAPGELGDYLREIAQYPLLTPDEELSLGQQIALGRRAARRLAAAESPSDRDSLEQQIEEGARARQRMVECNLRLVVSVARRYAGHGLSLQDLIQEGNIGLQTGIDKFDWRKGYRVSTYVYWWIRQAITRALANDSRTIRLPVHAGELLRAAAMTEQQLEAETGHKPSVDQIAARLGTQAERLRAIRVVATTPSSLDVTVRGENMRTQADILPDDSSTESFEEAAGAADLQESVVAVLDELPERERNILKLHYGLGTPGVLSLSEIGQRLGITRERARQIESQALRRLRGDNRIRRAYVDATTA